MRIVGGSLSGRRFSGPPGGTTRPTSERVREAVASALEARGWIVGARVLDLYAGTGALAFEALSRGAEHALLVEKNRRVAHAIERSAKELDLSERARVVCMDLEARNPERWIREIREPVSLVLIDPPYAQIDAVERILSALREHGRLAPCAAVVIEHAKKAPPTLPEGFLEVSSYRYGDTAILLATATDEAS